MSQSKPDISDLFFLRMRRAVDIIGVNAIICYLITSTYGYFVMDNPTSWFILLGIPPNLLALILNRRQLVVLAMSIIFFASSTTLMIYCIRTGEESYTHIHYILMISGISLLYTRKESRIHFYVNALYILFCLAVVFLSYTNNWFSFFHDPYVNPEMQRNMNFLFLVVCSVIFTSVIAVTNQRHQDALQESIEEQKVLLAEVNHRVKNNLAVITSLLNMQMNSARSKETKQAIQVVYNRVMSMALVHLKMYENDSKAAVDLKKYIHELVTEINNSLHFVREVKIEYELENVEMDVSSAIPIGLIMNELITNSIKHAFEDTEEPHIWIRLEKVGDKLLELTVRDNGKGMEEEVDNPEVGLGLDLIKSLTDQLDGKSTFQNERGVHFHLVIPYSK